MQTLLNDPRIAEKIWAKVVVTESGCWEWQGPIMSRLGYSRISMNNTRVLGHRYFYERLTGPIAKGLVIDHRCHNEDLTCDKLGLCPHRRCVNPAHLDAVTQAENCMSSTQTVANRNAAKTHCPRGHAYDADNTRILKTKGGHGRGCRTCEMLHAREYAARDREAHLQRGRDYYAANRERLLAAKRIYDMAKKNSRAPLSAPAE